MNAGEWSPNELKKALNEGLSQVSYHIKVLKDFGMIELTRTEPRAKSNDAGKHISISAVLLAFGSKDGKMANVPEWRQEREQGSVGDKPRSKLLERSSLLAQTSRCLLDG
jgi:DNA-binding transcriptional ArsR family regulator